jgi:hypothetical protein
MKFLAGIYKITPPKEQVKHGLPELALCSKPTGKINKRLSQTERERPILGLVQ